MKSYDAWKTTNPADAYLSQEEVDVRELDRLYQDNERLRAALQGLLVWNDRNGTYSELPPLIREAKTALERKP